MMDIHARSTLMTPPGRIGRHLEDLLSVLIPPVCLVCGELRSGTGEAGICGPCWAQVEYLSGPICPRCGRPHPELEDDDLENVPCGPCLLRRPPFAASFSMGRYRGTLKAILRLFKFANRPELAGPLAARASTVIRNRPAFVGRPDRIVPVPLPPLRRLRRGYNQSALLAKELGRILAVSVELRALARLGRARPQAALPSRERAANVRGAFRMQRPEKVAGQRILLVDDICTTGATLTECSRVLMQGGARQVSAFSLARTPERFDFTPSGGLH